MSMSETSHPGEAKSAPARSFLLPPLQEFYLPVVDTEMIGYIRKAVATAHAKAAVRAALEEASEVAWEAQETGQGAYGAIRAMLARLDAEEPKP